MRVELWSRSGSEVESDEFCAEDIRSRFYVTWDLECIFAVGFDKFFVCPEFVLCVVTLSGDFEPTQILWLGVWFG